MQVDDGNFQRYAVTRLKYEEVYLKDYTSAWEAEDSLWSYFRFYCHQRFHWAMGHRTPANIYFEAV